MSGQRAADAMVAELSDQIAGTFPWFLRLPANENVQRWRTTMGRGLLLWLIGIPLPIILIIWLLGGLN
jgi:hypothetical protein